MPVDHRRDLTLQKRCVTISPNMTVEQLRGFLRLIVEDTHRVKGLVRLDVGTFHVDCVGAYVNVIPIENEQEDNRLVILSGEGMPLRKSMKEALAWYGDWVTDAE